MRSKLQAFCLLLILGCAMAPAIGAFAQNDDSLRPGPKPITRWERAAVELAVAYVDRGPEAWWEALAENAPLRSLDKETALAEIEARLGPPSETDWSLQTPLESVPDGTAIFALQFPSGLEEAVFLNLVEREDGSAWELHSIRSWAEPVPERKRRGRLRELRDAMGDEEETAAPAAKPQRPVGIAMGLGLGGLALLGAGIFCLLREVRPTLVPVLLGAGLGLALLGVFAFFKAPAPQAPPPVKAEKKLKRPEVGGLASLVPLRRAMVEGVDNDALAASFSRAPTTGRAGAVARVWHAQHLFQRGELEQTEEILDDSELDGYPLADILRARLYRLQGDETASDAALAYDRVLDTVPDYDDLLIEVSDAMQQMGFEDRADDLLIRFATDGTRSSEIHYYLARVGYFEFGEDRALEAFRTAWNLQPLARVDVLGNALFAYLVRKGELSKLLELSNPREPAPWVEGVHREAITIPSSFTAVFTGNNLLIYRGESEIEVDNGGRIAPDTARAEDAESRRRRIEERGLRQLGELMALSRTRPAAIGQPALRDRIVTAVVALARRNRWGDVVQLTEGFARRPDLLPAELIQLRAEALRRSFREEDGARLLLYLARDKIAKHRKEPSALYQLADILVDEKRFEQAIKVAQKAEELSPEPPLVSVIPRIRMEKRLDSNFLIHQTEHFEIRYPKQTGQHFITRLGRVFEAEMKRLQRWIPHTPVEPIEVNLFPFSEFTRLYGGGDAVGLYDGKIRLPLAEVPSIHPVIVALVTHELAHAMIDGATNDQAPHWFHEGLAQHVQMVQSRINPIPDFVRTDKLVSFPLLEPVLTSYSDPMLVATAYEEVTWILHYLEMKHGLNGIHKLLAAFRRGLTTEVALQEVLGMSIVDFDESVWNWATNAAPAAWRTHVVRYDQEF